MTKQMLMIMTQAKIKEKGNDTQLQRGMYEQCINLGK